MALPYWQKTNSCARPAHPQSNSIKKSPKITRQPLPHNAKNAYNRAQMMSSNMIHAHHVRRRHRSSGGGRWPLLALGAAVLVVAAAVFFWPDMGTVRDVRLEGSRVAASLSGGASGNFVEVSVPLAELVEGEGVRALSDDVALQFPGGVRVVAERGAEIFVLSSRAHQSAAGSAHIRLDSGRAWLSSPSGSSRISVTLGQGGPTLSSKGEGSFLASESGIFVGKGQLELSGAAIGQLSLGQFFRPNTDESATLPPENLWADAFVRSGLGLGDLPQIVPPTPSAPPAQIVPPSSAAPAIVPAASADGILITFPPLGTDNTYQTSAEPVKITGRVPPQTTRVIVNGYALSRFSAGDSEFSYTAASAYGTISPGQNVYEIVAVAAGGIRSEKTVTIDFSPSAASQLDSAPAPVGELTITNPTAGQQISEDPALVEGRAPENTSAITVNGYRLTKYLAGSTSWNYFLGTDFGNRPVGQHTLTVQALDSAGRIIAEQSVDVEILPAAPIRVLPGLPAVSR